MLFNSMISKSFWALCLYLSISLQSAQGQEMAALKVIHVSNQLEYAYDHPGKTSSLTFDDLMGGYEEFSSWSEASIEYLRSSVPFLRIVIDLCFVPLKRIMATNRDKLADPKVDQEFIDRLEHYYIILRPLYYGASTGLYATSPRTDSLIQALTDKSSVSQDAAQISELMEEAWTEYETIEGRIDVITTQENIYSNVDDLALLLNYLNRPEVNALYDSVFPMMDSVHSELDVANLKSDYADALEARRRASSSS